MSVFKKLFLMLCMGVFIVGISGCPEQKKEGPTEGAGEKVEQPAERPAEGASEKMENHGGMEEHGGTMEEKTEEQPAQ